MPANVETMMFQGETPWHREGTRIPDGKNLTVREGIVESGLNWEVDLEPLITVAQATTFVSYAHNLHPNDRLDCEVQANVRHKAVVRQSDNRVLGVVGPRYNPLQNIEAFDWFQPFLDAGTATLHTAGSLAGGSKVWVLAQLNFDGIEVVKNDMLSKFILLSNSHDGSSAVRVGFTPIRVVCANTMAMAHSSGVSKLLRIRHSQQLLTNLDKVREIMNLANQEFEATAEQYRFLASRHINPKDLKKYVKVMLNIDPDKADSEVSSRSKNLLEQVLHLTAEGMGQNNPAVRGTWWGAYNGVTEYLNHKAGRDTNRLNNLWFGPNQTKLNQAIELAIQMAG